MSEAPVPRADVDRARAVRDALCHVVAERGFHGASMSAVARQAGVATGTAYVHYASKDELVYATYVEIKGDLGRAATADLDPDAPARERFASVWTGAYRHLCAHPERARFIRQVETSPYAASAHERALASGDDDLVAVAEAPDLLGRLVTLPPEVLFDLALGPAVRLAAAERPLQASQVDDVMESCWRAITR